MSRNYKKVEKYFNLNLWSTKMVFSAVNHWITADEYKQITGLEYDPVISEGN